MGTNLDKIYKLFLEHPVVSTDSRNIQDGALFFALKGENFNGNEFAASAIDLGASYAIIDEVKFAQNDRFLLVDDVLSTLQELARHHRQQFTVPVIAITGSNGKTTSKELIHKVLSKKFNTLSTRGNFNNHIGVPLTLLEISKTTDIAVIEMGANHPGEIDFLCRIALPGFGLITNIGKAHLEGFINFEGVIKTKTELSRYLNTVRGTMFVNNGDSLLNEKIVCDTKVTYGPPPADVTILNLVADPFTRLGLKFHDQTEIMIESQLYGGYNGNNIAAAACIGHHFGIPPVDIKSAIEEYQPGNNRSQIIKTSRNLLVLDAYNANPSSMEAALNMFAETSFPEKVVILGDMLELGSDSDQEHIKILGLIDRLGFKNVYLVGPDFSRLNTKREYICFGDTALAKLWMEHHRIENSTILIKGSRGIRLEKLVEFFR